VTKEQLGSEIGLQADIARASKNAEALAEIHPAAEPLSGALLKPRTEVGRSYIGQVGFSVPVLPGPSGPMALKPVLNAPAPGPPEKS
jgi:hypothetical protein